jgi:hypothetical protein
MHERIGNALNSACGWASLPSEDPDLGLGVESASNGPTLGEMVAVAGRRWRGSGTVPDRSQRAWYERCAGSPANAWLVASRSAAAAGETQRLLWLTR